MLYSGAPRTRALLFGVLLCLSPSVTVLASACGSNTASPAPPGPEAGAADADGGARRTRKTIADDAGTPAQTARFRPTSHATRERRARLRFARRARSRRGLGRRRRSATTTRSASDIPINHVIVIMQENRSFDHYLGRLVAQGYYQAGDFTVVGRRNGDSGCRGCHAGDDAG